MKKNIILIATIFILPIIAYVVLSSNQAVSAVQRIDGQPQVIKFSSKLCIDCKKLKKEFDELVPEYKNKITITEYNIDGNDKEVNEAIKKHNINLVPTVLFLDKNGNEIRRTEGFVNKTDLEQYFKELLKW